MEHGGGKRENIALNSNAHNVDRDWGESAKHKVIEMYNKDLDEAVSSQDSSEQQSKEGKCCQSIHVIQIVREYNKRVKVQLPLTCFNFHYSLMAINVCVGLAMLIQGWRWEDITCKLGEVNWPSSNAHEGSDTSLQEDSQYETTTANYHGSKKKSNQRTLTGCKIK